MKRVTKKFTMFVVVQNLPWLLWAGFGVSSTFAKVNVGGIEAGRVMRVSAVGQPLTVTNTSNITVTLSLRITRPKQNEVEYGFEPVPTVVWAVLEKNEFILPPGKSATTDIILKPPLEEKYRNKNYQVHILSRVIGSGNVRIVMVHKLQFSIPKETAVTRGSYAETSKLKIQPAEFVVKNIDVGRLSSGPNPTLTVKNTDRKPHRYRLRTFNPEASLEFEPYAINIISPPVPRGNNQSEFALHAGGKKTITPSNGMTIAADELLPRNWLSMGVKEFELKPGEEKSFPIKIYIPNRTVFKNRRILSLIRVTQLDEIFYSTLIPVYIETTSQGYADAPASEFQRPVYVDVRTEIAQ